MDTHALLAVFEEQMRRRMPPAPGESVERGEDLTRVISADGWSGVIWSDLAGADVAAVVAEQISRFAALGHSWEWKHYSPSRRLPGMSALSSRRWLRRSAPRNGST